MSRRWEMLYDYYKSAEAQERIEYLKTRMDEGEVPTEVTEEYNKMQKVINYLPKVDNLREAIESLESNLEILKEEYSFREENSIVEKMKNKAADLEKRIEEKRAEAEKLHEVAEDDDYWKKVFEVQDMEAALGTLKGELSEKQNIASKHPELSGFSKDDLRKEIFKTAGQISKCHVAAELYMKGESSETIEFAVKKDNKFKRYKAEDPLPLTRKEREQRKQQRQETRDLEVEESSENIAEAERIENSSEQSPVQEPIGVVRNIDEEPTQALVNIDEIKNKHGFLSTLAKVPLLGRFAKRRLDKIVEKEYREIRDHLRETIERDNADSLQNEGQSEQGNEPKTVLNSREERAKFIKGLSAYDVTDIAEKGLESLEKQRRAEKLLEAKESAVLRQNAKFGQDYSDRSGDQAQLDARYNDDGDER